MNFEALYILGDLFEYWIGDDAAEYLQHTDTERWLKNLSNNGVQVYIMRGNRDFLLGQIFAQNSGCKLIEEPLVVDLFGEPTLLMHGDALCIDDVAHQRWRKQSLSKNWQEGFLAKTIQERFEIAQQLRQHSENEKQKKPMEIMDVNIEAVHKIMRQHNVRKLIHGHTHRPAIHVLDIKGNNAQRIVLGDWYEQKSVLLVNENGMSLTPNRQ